ncbi:MAG: hypothetical protein JWL84_1898, partial [Rhodospirillales bacterium]|nr:hypothetical protein [Rhodospirillales bacterium]
AVDEGMSIADQAGDRVETTLDIEGKPAGRGRARQGFAA